MTHEIPKPILEGEGHSDYERYLRTDALLALQKTADEWVHRDELLFQTVHQSSELWLKLAWNEIEEAARLVDAGDLAAANRLLRRAVDCFKLVTAALDMLEHMSPWEYQEIRVVLGHGSGFDSPGFRRVPKVTQRISTAFNKALDAAGLDLAELYQQGRRHEALYQLAEALTDWDSRIWIWRFRHYTVVARSLGEQTIGTQGTPVEVLGKLIEHRYIPKLWKTRARLVELFDEEQA